VSALEKRCPACHTAAPLDAAACPGCGRPFASINPQKAPHDVSVAAMLSIFLPGGGEMYNHQLEKGILLVLLFVVPLAVALVMWQFKYALLAPVVWCVSVTDASLIAGRLLRGETVRPWQWF
jgi:hypothetical protein